MNQIRLDIVGHRRRVETCDRGLRPGDFDEAHGSKPSAVIETRQPRQVIEALLVDPTARRFIIRKAQYPTSIGFGAKASNSVNRQRFVRQPRAARQLPISFLGPDQGADLAHATFVEGQWPAHFEIA